MVGRIPDWEARRIRHPIPNSLPGYMLMPYLSPTPLYQLTAAGTMLCIDLGNGQIISDGQSCNVDSGANDGADLSTLPSCCPADNSISLAWTASGTISRAYGLVGQQGDTSLLFPILNSGGNPQELICDSSNGPAEYACYTTANNNSNGQTHWYFCRKNDLVVTTINTSFGGLAGASGVDCDRAGNWFLFSNGGFAPNVRNTLERQSPNGSGALWSVNPDHTGASTPLYGPARSGRDKLIVVGPPELDGSIWHQNVFVALPTGWLSKHDCRNGNFVAGGMTTLRPSQLNATGDGLVLISNGVVTKVSLDTLATIWTHDPTKFTPSTLLPQKIVTDCCGDVIYSTGADAQGAVHIRKVNGETGLPLLDQPFFLPIAGMPIVAGSGRIGGYSSPCEPWALAGMPSIAFP
jgi:hypothetical protein